MADKTGDDKKWKAVRKPIGEMAATIGLIPPLTHRFTLAIGDWSGDGHDRRRELVYACSHPVAEVREAYFVAKERYPLLDPATYAKEYGDTTIPQTIIDAWKRVTDIQVADPGWVSSEEIADLAIAFFKLGNEKLCFERQNDGTEAFHFYGKDSQGRHIKGFGYGLFES